MRDDTDWHFHYPQVGDRFYELHQSYIEVRSVDEHGVAVMEYAPEPRPRFFRSVAHFRQSYQRSDVPGAYIVRYQGREQ